MLSERDLDQVVGGQVYQKFLGCVNDSASCQAMARKAGYSNGEVRDICRPATNRGTNQCWGVNVIR